MASDVDICNLALSLIGQDANITSIDPPDSTVEADHCARFYPIARAALLQAHAWGFATRRQALASVENDVDHWAFAYALPNPCIRPLAVLLPQSSDDSKVYPFALESDADGVPLLYTNVEAAVLKYTTLVTDPTRFPPLFVVAFARLLAYYIAGPITKNEKLVQEQLKLFEGIDLPRAAGSDGNSQKNHPYSAARVPSAIQARQ